MGTRPRPRWNSCLKTLSQRACRERAETTGKAEVALSKDVELAPFFFCPSLPGLGFFLLITNHTPAGKRRNLWRFFPTFAIGMADAPCRFTPFKNWPFLMLFAPVSRPAA